MTNFVDFFRTSPETAEHLLFGCKYLDFKIDKINTKAYEELVRSSNLKLYL